MDAGTLNERVSRLAAAADIAEDMPQALLKAASDPADSLTKSRIVLERLLKSVAKFEKSDVKPGATVGYLVQLKALVEKIPKSVRAEMSYVNDVASCKGPHALQPDEIPADEATAIRVLDHLCYAVEWYAYRYLHAGLIDNFGIPINNDDVVVAYVSTGGTCRCVIANMVTRYYLNNAAKLLHIRPLSLAFNRTTSDYISKFAADVLHKELNIDAKNHRSIQADERYYKRAALILVMDEKLLGQIQQKESPGAVLFKQFYGGRGGIEDPYVQGTLKAYQKCFREVHSLIKRGIPKLVAQLDAN